MKLRKPSMLLRSASFVLGAMLLMTVGISELSHHFLAEWAPKVNWLAMEVAFIATLLVLFALMEMRVLNEYREKENFHTMLQNVSQSLAIISREYKIEFGNRVFAEQAGLTEDKVVGRFCHSVSHHYDRPCYELGEDCPVKRVFETGEAQTVVHTHVDTFGEKRNFQLRACPVRNVFGKVVSVMEITSDITEQRRLERQLQFADKMEAVGKLAGGIAHDFNNILGVISGYGSLLKLRLKSIGTAHSELESEIADLLEYVNTSEEAVDSAARLSSELLIFSSRRPLDPKPMRINTVLSRMNKVLPRVMPEDIQVSVKMSSDNMTIIGDSSQLEQVLMNLAINARDAMPKGGQLSIAAGSLILGQDSVEKMGFGIPGLYATLTVSDTGTGIEQAVLKKIFDPFFTTKELGKGTGLGLAMVYGLVKQHGGYIDVKSGIGQGTQFTVYLPAAEVSVVEESRKEKDMATGAGTILLVEDDNGMRQVTEKLLQVAGYEVIAVRNGEDGLNELRGRGRQIGLMIIDLVLPKMDGYEFFLESKRIRDNIGVVFVSGYGNDVLLEKGIRKDEIPLLPKPFSSGDLLELVKQKMGKG